MNDFPVAAYNARVSGDGNDFEVVGEQLDPGPYGIGVRKDDVALRDALRDALAGHHRRRHLRHRPGQVGREPGGVEDSHHQRRLTGPGGGCRRAAHTGRRGWRRGRRRPARPRPPRGSVGLGRRHPRPRRLAGRGRRRVGRHRRCRRPPVPVQPFDPRGGPQHRRDRGPRPGRGHRPGRGVRGDAPGRQPGAAGDELGLRVAVPGDAGAGAADPVVQPAAGVRVRRHQGAVRRRLPHPGPDGGLHDPVRGRVPRAGPERGRLHGRDRAGGDHLRRRGPGRRGQGPRDAVPPSPCAGSCCPRPCG